MKPFPKRAILVVAALIVGLLAYFFWSLWGLAPSPSGQPPVIAINAENFDRFREAFNAPGGAARVLLLLSPT